MNTCTVPLVRYSGSLLKWTRDKRTRGQGSWCRCTRPSTRRDDIYRLYVSIKEGVRALTNIEDSVDASIRRLDNNTDKSKERWILTTRNNTDKIRTNRTTITRKLKWEEKQVYGYFQWQTDEISHEKTWTWLQRENESFLIAAQNNAIRTNYIKAKIDNAQQISKCRLCGDRDETINYIISKLA